MRVLRVSENETVIKCDACGHIHTESFVADDYYRDTILPTMTCENCSQNGEPTRSVFELGGGRVGIAGEAPNEFAAPNFTAIEAREIGRRLQIHENERGVETDLFVINEHLRRNEVVVAQGTGAHQRMIGKLRAIAFFESKRRDIVRDIVRFPLDSDSLQRNYRLNVGDRAEITYVFGQREQVARVEVLCESTRDEMSTLRRYTVLTTPNNQGPKIRLIEGSRRREVPTRPPQHTNCRNTIVPIMDRDSMRSLNNQANDIVRRATQRACNRVVENTIKRGMMRFSESMGQAVEQVRPMTHAMDALGMAARALGERVDRDITRSLRLNVQENKPVRITATNHRIAHEEFVRRQGKFITHPYDPTLRIRRLLP